MEFRILGPLEVFDGAGRPVAVGGSRERAVLALLLLSANRVVSTERLVDELWPYDSPDGALHALRVYTSRLRTALRTAGAPDLVITRPPGYLAQVSPDAVDATRFEALVTAGRARVAAGDHAGGSEALGEALALWRGQALADVVDVPAVRAEAARLDEARLVGLEERVDADLACGRHREVVAELEWLTGENPLRERFWGQRMLALYRCGRQADSLRVYQNLRRALRGGLGLEPSAALTRLEHAMLRQAPDLDWAPDRPHVRTPDAPVLPLPAELAVDGPRPFVGREAEVEAASGCILDPGRDRAAVLWLLGEPGIGKTRVATEIARRVHRAGATVLFGRCNEDLPVPYQPFLEALRWQVLHLPDAEVTARLGDAAGELTRLLPELAPRVDGSSPLRSTSPEVEQLRLFEAVRSWLAAAGGGAPAVAVFDDVHWATRPTLAMLAHVARSAERSRAAFVCTARTTAPDESGALAALAEGLARRGLASWRVDLGGLPVEQVGALVASTLGRPLDGGLRRLAVDIHRETAGNPLFLDSWMEALAADPDRHPDVLPRTLVDTVLARLARLPAVVGEVLRVASVVGLDFDLRVVARAAGRDELTVLSALEKAQRAALVEETHVDRYRFSHGLVRAALGDALSRSRRVRIHVAVARGIEAVFGDDLEPHVPALAQHWARAGTDPQTAAGYSTRAGRLALRQLAYDEAARCFAAALDLSGPASPERLELTLALGDAQRRAGDPAHRATILAAADLARRAGDARALGRAALTLGRPGFMSTVGRTDAEHVAVLEQAVDALDDDDPLRPLLLARLAVELVYAHDRDRVLALSDAALAGARQRGDVTTLAAVLLDRVMAIKGPGTLDERLASAAELEALMAEAGDPVLEFGACFNRGRALLDAGQVAAGAASLQRAAVLADELGQPTLQWMATWVAVGPALLAGRLAEADRLLDAALALDQPDAGLGVTQRTLIRFEQDRVGEITGLLSQVRARYPNIPGLGAYLAFALCESGQHAGAGRLLRLLAGEGFDLPRDPFWLPSLMLAADVARTLDHRDAATTLYGLLAPEPHVWGYFGGASTGVTVHSLGVLAAALGDLDAATAHLADAAARYEAAGAVAHLGRTRVEQARLLLLRGPDGSAEAVDMLTETLEQAKTLGLANVARRALSALTEAKR